MEKNTKPIQEDQRCVRKIVNILKNAVFSVNFRFLKCWYRRYEEEYDGDGFNADDESDSTLFFIG